MDWIEWIGSNETFLGRTRKTFSPTIDLEPKQQHFFSFLQIFSSDCESGKERRLHRRRRVRQEMDRGPISGKQRGSGFEEKNDVPEQKNWDAAIVMFEPMLLPLMLLLLLLLWLLLMLWLWFSLLMLKLR